MRKSVYLLVVILLIGVFGCAGIKPTSSKSVQDHNSDNQTVQTSKTKNTKSSFQQGLEEAAVNMEKDLKKITIKYPPVITYHIQLKYNGYKYNFNLRKDVLYRLKFLDNNEFGLERVTEPEFQRRSMYQVYFKIGDRDEVLNIYANGEHYMIPVQEAYRVKVFLSATNTVVFEVNYTGLTDKSIYTTNTF